MINRFRILALIFFAAVLTVFGCGGSQPTDAKSQDDPAMTEEGNPSTDTKAREIDPAVGR